MDASFQPKNRRDSALRPCCAIGGARATCSVLCVALILLFSTGCAHWRSGFDNPRVDLAGLEPLGTEDGSMQFAVTLRIVNPNPMDLNIKGLYYEIRMEDHELVTGATSDPALIPAYGEGLVRLQAAPSLYGALRLISSLVARGSEKTALNYELYAKISVGGYVAPLRIRRQGVIDLREFSPLGGHLSGDGAGAPEQHSEPPIH